MYYGAIKTLDIANGEGIRTSLFVSGCKNHCKGCFQPETWDFQYGNEFTGGTLDYLIETLRDDHVDGLTILGGDPFEVESQYCVLKILDAVKNELPEKTIWVYTGYRYCDLMPGGKRCTDYTDIILDMIDVLVDGPFIEELKDLSLPFRGSRNQRLIDVRQTRSCGHIVLYGGSA